MKIILPKIRKMQDELKQPTGEVRITYDLPGFRSNTTYHARGETQNRHTHLLLGGGHNNLAGSMKIQDDKGKWFDLKENEVSFYEPGEMYNVRIPADAPPVVYPGADEKVGAVSMFYKYLMPGIDVSRDEAELVFQNDWFGENFLKDPSDKKSSPALRLDEPYYSRFWDIVRRNRENLGPATVKFQLPI